MKTMRFLFLFLTAVTLARAQVNVTRATDGTFDVTTNLGIAPGNTLTNSGTITGSGPIGTTGTLSSGTFSTGAFTTTGSLTVSGSMTVSGSSTVQGLTAGAISVTSGVNTGNGTVSGSFTVSGSATLATVSATTMTASTAKLTTVSLAGSLLGSSPTAGIGYGAGSGSISTQLTSKATGVTINAVVGQITMNTASLASATNVQFTLTDSAIAANDIVWPVISSGGTMGSYQPWTAAVGTGTAEIAIRNVNASTLSESPVITFIVLKGSAN